MNFALAKLLCTSRGGKLAAFETENEYNKFADMFYDRLEFNQDAYIALKDKYPNGSVQQWDSGDPSTYSRLAAGQPDDFGHDCYIMKASGSHEWYDENCAVLRNYICEKGLNYLYLFLWSLSNFYRSKSN